MTTQTATVTKHPTRKENATMTTQTATKSEQAHQNAEKKIQKVRELYADGPQYAKTALENSIGELTSQASKPRSRMESAGRTGSRQGKVREPDLTHMNRVKMMGELAASLAHEITQPIASARNNARAAQKFLDMKPLDLGEVKEAIACTVGDVDRAGDIVDRIREHTKKTPPRKECFDLNTAINEMIGLARNVIIANGVSVRTRLAGELLSVVGDRIQLQQVVLNLILNAVEAMSSIEARPRELLISTEYDHTWVLVAVRDSGPGIDPSHRERVFEAFYTTKSSGTGMGLSICRAIIDAHGGRLWADANESGGAIFQFALPILS